MTATLVRNRTSFPVTLPYPYSGILPPGGACILASAASVVLPRLGVLADRTLEVRDVSDSEMLSAPGNGTFTAPASAKLLQIGPVAAKGTTDVHAALAGNAGRAKLLLDTGTGDATVTAVTSGVNGNFIDIVLTGDGGSGVRIARTTPLGRQLFTILYETGVSTQGTLNAAINALAGGDKLIEVTTANAGTTVTVLTAPGDDFAETALAGGSDVGTAFPGPFTSPVWGRNLRLVFATNYDGGNVTVTGTRNGAVQTEVVVAVAGTTVVGLKVWDTVVSAVKAAVGSNEAAVSIGTGDTLSPGVGIILTDNIAQLWVAGTSEAVTVSATTNTVIPTTTPNATTYRLLANLQQTLAP